MKVPIGKAHMVKALVVTEPMVKVPIVKARIVKIPIIDVKNVFYVFVFYKQHDFNAFYFLNVFLFSSGQICYSTKPTKF